jgi:ATPase subunit of ABC transporter with duplicated ATPase domains
MLFSGDDAERPTATLSGGERVRTLLARLMLLQHNVLVLDEPTNHMDLEGVSAIRDSLESYKGTVLYVTHHRDLIEGVATKVILVEDGKCEVFTGGFAEYLKLRGRK